ncbi:MAG: O-antigen polymerase [Ginsengibacter sp.]
MKKKIMHPVVLFSLVWLTVLVLHFIFRFTLLDELFPISASTFLIFFIGTLAFSFGGFIQTVIVQKNEMMKSRVNYIPDISQQSISSTLRFICLAIVVIGLPFYIIASYRLFLASNIEDFFVGLRTELVYGDADIGLIKYLLPFSFVVYAINLYEFFKAKTLVNKLFVITSLLASITYSIFVTGRTYFLIILLLYVGLSFLLNKKFSAQKISRLIAVFLLLFILVGILYGKGGDYENSLKENIKPAAETTAIYLVSALNGLEWEKTHQFHINYNANNSLRFFIKIGELFNLTSNAQPKDLINSFVFVPYPTNVFTIYSPYLRDFGKYYAWFMLTIFGFVHTFFFNKAVATKNLRYSLYFSFLLFPLVMSFFADLYLSLFSFWIQITFFVEGFIFINKFLSSKNDRHSNHKLE